MMVGNGENTYIDGDVWVGKERLKMKPEASPFLRNQKVEALMSAPEIWNYNLIWNSFERKDARNILASYLPAISCADEIVWDNNTSGKYSVKSGYWKLMDTITGEDSRGRFCVQWVKRSLFP